MQAHRLALLCVLLPAACGGGGGGGGQENDDRDEGGVRTLPPVDAALGGPELAQLTDGVAAPITTRFRPNDAPSHAFPRALLPLVDLPGEDLVGFQITGMRYHSWNAYNDRVVPKATQLEGAAVIYGRSP